MIRTASSEFSIQNKAKISDRGLIEKKINEKLVVKMGLPAVLFGLLVIVLVLAIIQLYRRRRVTYAN